MRLVALVVALAFCGHALAALPGITEFGKTPEELTDAELAALLDARVASADVVALGETVHGSSGFLRIQTRLVRYLVAQHRFRLILWENPTLRSLELTRWLASCTRAKTPPPVDVLYMPTPSDVPLFDWLCDFNRTHSHDPIAFRGIDVWDRPWEHFARIRSLGGAAGIDPRLARHVDAACPASHAASWPEVHDVVGRIQGDKVFPEADFERCRAALSALVDAARQAGLARRKDRGSAADDAFEVAISASTLLGWLGFYQYNFDDDILSWNARDQAQGRNMQLAMEKHGVERAVVAAHTSHVSHNRSPADWWGFGDIKSGIHFFSALTRKRVFNIAFTGYDASGTQGHWSAPAARNSMDRKLHDAGHAFAFFASNAAFLSEHPRWWMQNQNYPGPYESGVEIVPADHFDAFIFLARSHLDRALPARPMWEP